MKLQKRQVVLAVALTLALVATVFAPDPEQTAVAAAIAPAASAEVSALAGAVRVSNARTPEQILGIRPRDQGDRPQLAFQPRQWTTPAAKPRFVKTIAKAEPAEVKAPPLPFKVLGQYLDGGEPAVFLQFNDVTLVVKAGETVNENYQVESIAEGKITFLYVPLAEKQTLALGDAK